MTTFGALAIEEITPNRIELWRRSLNDLSNRRNNKLLIILQGVFRRAQTAYGLAISPIERVEKHPQRRSGDVEVFSPEELWALVRAAASNQDGTLFLTAAFTGLRRGELLALHWRDVDFAGSTIRVRASYAGGTGGYLDGSALCRRYKAALARAGLRQLHFHDLRHTSARG
jgi:integrase